MNIGICNFCNRNGCTNSRKFSSLLTECSAFVSDTKINWEERRYEIAKDLFIKTYSRSDSRSQNELNIKYAVKLADKLIDELKKKG